jgi:hypothetical protein
MVKGAEDRGQSLAFLVLSSGLCLFGHPGLKRNLDPVSGTRHQCQDLMGFSLEAVT